AGFGGDHRAGRGAGDGQAAETPSGRVARAAPEPALGIECYHVNARLSQKLEDIGDFRIGKFLLLLGYSAQAIWCRFRYGVTTLYYIPAPGKRSALYRDWMVMLLCRPFFRRIILHWHAAGLAKWLEMVVQLRTRALTYRLMKRVDLSIVLSKFNQADAEKLFSRRIVVVNNGIPDPCPTFTEEVLPRRKARLAARQKLLSGAGLTPADLQDTGGDPHLFKVLYLAHCTREKGLFDTLDAVALANRKLAQAKSPIQIHLSVAGDFINAAERDEFQRRLAQPDLRLPAAAQDRLNHGRAKAPLGAPASADSSHDGLHPGRAKDLSAPGDGACVTYAGFVFGPVKQRILIDSDCFCFPTYYYAESFGLVLVEAMALGLPVITTRWRSIPELLPQDYPGFVDVRSPSQIAERLEAVLTRATTGEELREIFLRNFTLEHHLAGLASAIRSTESAAEAITDDTARPSRNQSRDPGTKLTKLNSNHR
ncbi:MAG TPA: glycosyltransferase family 4 protein, partial [Dongiaceae bacterium]|nr:glycosyltransferase family 4 protein [Dongiaceae bacterium]